MSTLISKKLRLSLAMTGLILLSACATFGPGDGMPRHCNMCPCCAQMSDKGNCACCNGHTCPSIKGGKGMCCDGASGKAAMCRPK
jgi:hypothetical protein